MIINISGNIDISNHNYRELNIKQNNASLKGISFEYNKEVYYYSNP